MVGIERAGRVNLSEVSDEPHAYTYTRYRPSKLRIGATERMDHRFAYTKRKDKLAKAPKGIAYRAECSCNGWKDTEFVSQRIARMHWEMQHIREVEKQQPLF
jgi:hypothetical protein